MLELTTRPSRIDVLTAELSEPARRYFRPALLSSVARVRGVTAAVATLAPLA